MTSIITPSPSQAARELAKSIASKKSGADAGAGFYLPYVRASKPGAGSLPRFFKALRDYRHDLQPLMKVVGFGSSVGLGATLANPLVDAPVAYFFTRLKEVLDKGGLYNLSVLNKSENGTALTQLSAKLAAVVAGGDTPLVSVLAYGMNDAQVAIYNSGQTFPFVYSEIMRHVREARALGSDVVIMTTPHHQCLTIPYAMPAGVNQVYPTAIPAPVGPTQIQPSAATSNIVGDFAGTGTPITVSHRHLRVNQAMRQAAKDAGVPLIDVEPYWFAAVARYGEPALFNAGETVHPNLLGHQSSYQAAISEFIEAIGSQTSQAAEEPRLNGLVGINVDIPKAVLDIGIPYPDTTSNPLHVPARIGATDANGVKATAVAWKVENETGDLVGTIVNKLTNAPLEIYRYHGVVDASGTIVDNIVETLTSTNGVAQTRRLTAQANVGGVATLVNCPFLLPDNSTGTIRVRARNGVGFRYARVGYLANAGVITFGAAESLGANSFTGPTAVGLQIGITTTAANTNISWQIESETGI
ncbi:MAG: hypothetical protein NVS9B2_27910 [Steroidobacteraceae bacterium]